MKGLAMRATPRTARVQPAVQTPAVVGTQKRRDQKQCPKCHHWGCPATGGTRQRSEGVYRYRVCEGCGHTHCTLQKHGAAVEEIVA